MPPTNTSMKAPRTTLTGRVQKVTDTAVEIDGILYGYARIFKGEKLGAKACGSTVEVLLVQAKADNQSFIVAINRIDEGAAPSPAPAPKAAPEATLLPAGDRAPSQESASESATQDTDAASPDALKYAEDLALKAGFPSEDLEALVERRFQKAFADLTKDEASRTIVFFGGYVRDNARRSSKRS